MYLVIKAAFLTILLSSFPIDTVIGKLGEYSVVFMLLGVAVYVLWRKVSRLEDRITKYQDEDRDKMLTVIQNNTNALNLYTQSNERHARVMEHVENQLEEIKKTS